MHLEYVIRARLKDEDLRGKLSRAQSSNPERYLSFLSIGGADDSLEGEGVRQQQAGGRFGLVGRS